MISKLNGKKILVKGNHDKKYDTELFEEICDFKTVSLNGVYFALMHYPMLSWPKKNSGSIQLHGHIHAREEYNFQNKVDGITRYDVGVDANCYYPVSVKQIIKFFENNEGKQIVNCLGKICLNLRQLGKLNSPIEKNVIITVDLN